MAASDHLQLQLFYHPDDLDSMVKNDFRLAGQSDEEGWAEKEAEARVSKAEDPYGHGAGVYDSMKEHGMWTDAGPQLRVNRGYEGSEDERGRVPHLLLTEGHHRAAAARALTREGQTTWVYPDLYGGNPVHRAELSPPRNYKGEPDYARYDYLASDPEPPGGWTAEHRNVPQWVLNNGGTDWPRR